MAVKRMHPALCKTPQMNPDLALCFSSVHLLHYSVRSSHRPKDNGNRHNKKKNKQFSALVAEDLPNLKKAIWQSLAYDSLSV